MAYQRGHCRGTKRERPGNDWWREAYLVEVERVEAEWQAQAQDAQRECPSAVLGSLPGAGTPPHIAR